MDGEPALIELLRQVEAGDELAIRVLLGRIDAELRAMASSANARPALGAAADQPASSDRPGRGKSAASAHVESRRKLFFAYARLMARILADRARRAAVAQRGRTIRAMVWGAGHRASTAGGRGISVSRLQALLPRLRRIAPQEADVVELHVFAGLSTEQIGEVLGLRPQAVRDTYAQARRRIATWRAN